MKKEFVPYEQALALKELGFDEPCFGFYQENNNLINKLIQKKQKEQDEFSELAPTYSQAFRFFREKYDLNYVIVKAESWFYTINGCNTQEGFNTYEEAELACLDKLIEIIESK